MQHHFKCLSRWIIFSCWFVPTTPASGIEKVEGFTEPFQQIELAGGQVQPSDLAAGIWKALLTTVFGLIVALPTLAIFHLFDSRVGSLALQMQWLVAHLNEWTSTASNDAPIVNTTAVPAANTASGPIATAQPAALSIEEG